MLPVLLSILLYPPAPPVEPPPDSPRGAPPVMAAVRMSKDGKLLSEQLKTVTVLQTVTEQVIANGKAVTRTRQVPMMMETHYTEVIDLAKARITDAAGRPIAREDLARRLTRLTPVVLSSNGQPIDRAYLLVLKPDTIVIVAQRSVRPPPPPLPPPPPVVPPVLPPAPPPAPPPA